MKRFAIALTLITLCAWANAQAPAAVSMELRWSTPQAIEWSGIPASESSFGTSTAMLYPAADAGGLIVAILAHAVLVNGSRESERRARQKAADQILEPYQSIIARLDAMKLTSELQAHPAIAQNNPGSPFRIVHLQPHFRISADHRVIVLDARIRLQDPSDSSTQTPPTERVVQVVSTPREGEDPLASWLENDAHRFREEIVTMLAHSIHIAVKATSVATEPLARTQRYAFGNEIRMERGQVLATGCGRTVLWTLRESWMSVPVIPLSPSSCNDRYQLASQ